MAASDSATQDGAIDQASDEALYKISAPANGVVAVVIDKTDDSKLDAALHAYTDKHKEISQNDADADRRVSQIFIPVKADQNVFVKVGACDGTTGKFKVTFKHLDKPGGGFDTAQEVRLSKTGLAAQSWRLERDGEEQYFRLSSPQAGWMFVEVANALGNNLDGTLTGFDDVRRPLGYPGRLVRFHMMPGKTYFVKAASLPKPMVGLSRTGGYTLNFRLVKSTPDDHGNDFASATKVTLDLFGSAPPIQGTIENELDVDCFVFQATKTGSMKLSLFFPFDSQPIWTPSWKPSTAAADPSAPAASSP